MELLNCSFPGILPASMLAAEIQNLSAAGPEKAGLQHSFCAASPYMHTHQNTTVGLTSSSRACTCSSRCWPLYFPSVSISTCRARAFQVYFCLEKCSDFGRSGSLARLPAGQSRAEELRCCCGPLLAAGSHSHFSCLGLTVRHKEQLRVGFPRLPFQRLVLALERFNQSKLHLSLANSAVA